MSRYRPISLCLCSQIQLWSIIFRISSNLKGFSRNTTKSSLKIGSLNWIWIKIKPSTLKKSCRKNYTLFTMTPLRIQIWVLKLQSLFFNKSRNWDRFSLKCYNFLIFTSAFITWRSRTYLGLLKVISDCISLTCKLRIKISGIQSYPSWGSHWYCYQLSMLLLL